MLRLNFEEAEKEICTILQHAYPDDECNFKDSGAIIRNEAINASGRGVKIRALVNEEFIIPKMEFMKERGMKEKIMDNVEIRVMKKANPSYFEGFLFTFTIIVRFKSLFTIFSYSPFICGFIFSRSPTPAIISPTNSP